MNGFKLSLPSAPGQKARMGAAGSTETLEPCLGKAEMETPKVRTLRSWRRRPHSLLQVSVRRDTTGRLLLQRQLAV
jgi:hypothetical protein